MESDSNESWAFWGDSMWELRHVTNEHNEKFLGNSFFALQNLHSLIEKFQSFSSSLWHGTVGKTDVTPSKKWINWITVPPCVCVHYAASGWLELVCFIIHPLLSPTGKSWSFSIVTDKHQVFASFYHPPQSFPQEASISRVRLEAQVGPSLPPLATSKPNDPQILRNDLFRPPPEFGAQTQQLVRVHFSWWKLDFTLNCASLSLCPDVYGRHTQRDCKRTRWNWDWNCLAGPDG